MLSGGDAMMGKSVAHRRGWTNKAGGAAVISAMKLPAATPQTATVKWWAWSSRTVVNDCLGRTLHFTLSNL